MTDPTFKINVLDVIARVRICASGPLNHQDIQQLFGVKRRRAFELLHLFGARPGVAGLFIDRDVLERDLLDLALYYETESAAVRRQLFDERMEWLRKARGQRFADYPISVNKATWGARADSLPASIRFEPGRIVIEHTGFDDGLGKLFLLSQALLNDADTLRERFENAEPEKARSAGG